MRAAIRYLAEIHDEIPAFRAGFFVLSLIFAGLLNFGVFLLLIAVHMGLDVMKYRDYHGYSWRLTIRGTLRENALDLMLLSLGLSIAVGLYASPGFWVLLPSSVRFRLASVAGVLASKLLILFRFVRVLAHPQEHLKMTKPAKRAAWTAGEQFNLFLAFFLLGVLALLIVRGAGDADFVQWLALQCIPWKI